MEEEIARRLAELPYLPSSERVIRAGFSLARPKPEDVLVDLGCGDGRVLIYAAKNYGIYSVGYELNPVLVSIAKREVAWNRVKHLVDIVEGDLFDADLSRFTIVYAYPSPAITRRLSIKILSECMQGCRVIVHDHPLEGIDSAYELRIPSGAIHVHRVYLYII